MIKSFTSIEQGRDLLNAGLDPNTADMRYFRIDDEYFADLNPYKQSAEKTKTPPCWSMARLIALLPETIVVNPNSRLRKRFNLEITKLESWRYAVGYYCGVYPNQKTVKEFDCMDSPLDALVDLLAWVMLEGYEDKQIQREIAEDE